MAVTAGPRGRARQQRDTDARSSPTTYPEQHSVLRSLLLHLLPAVPITAGYVVVAPTVRDWGYPPLFALLLTGVIVTIPLLLGFLLVQARRRTGSYDVRAVVDYRTGLPVRRYLALGLPLMLWTALVYAASDALLPAETIERLFAWLPDWYLDPQNIDEMAAMSAASLVVLFGAWFVVAVAVGPVVEELYFRGHLLPRLDRFGAWAAAINVALFSLYHLWTPWQNPARILALLPLVYLVWRHRSIWLSVFVHVTLNTLSLAMVVLAVLAAR
jgi:uncharacterized protein